jgi:hypothetical protein
MIKRLLIALALVILMLALVIMQISIPIIIFGISIPITALIFIAAGILLLTLVLPILMGGC